MFTVYQKVQKIESLQKTIDKETMAFKHNAGIDCEKHCAECCRYHDINATPLEFLPFAWHSYRLGLLDQWFDRLENCESSQCIFASLIDGNWGCSIYPARGFICRLFGFSAATDKNGHPVFAACRVLKQKQPAMINNASQFVAGGGKIPIMASYYRRLAAIEPALGTQFMPINDAIRKALEIIYFHLHYRESA